MDDPKSVHGVHEAATVRVHRVRFSELGRSIIALACLPLASIGHRRPSLSSWHLFALTKILDLSALVATMNTEQTFIFTLPPLGGEGRVLSLSRPFLTEWRRNVEKTNLRPVTRQAPCAVCGGDHKCAHGADGLILCGRRNGPQPGFVYLGPCAKDPTWHLYRHQGQPAPRPPLAAPSPARTDWNERLRSLVKQLGSEAAVELGRQLGLPEHVLALLPVGYDATGPEEPIWFFRQTRCGRRRG
jgi:hypothetical protein